MYTEDQRLWSVGDVARYLGVPITTLYQWRSRGYGPPGRRVGRYVRYDADEVRSWFASINDNTT